MRWAHLFLAGLLLASCATADPADGTGVPETHPGSAADDPVDGEPVFQVELDGAVAVNVASNGIHDPIVAWITPEHVMAAGIELATGEMTEAVEIDGGVTPIAHPIERPAVAVGTDGRIDIAFTSFQGSGASVYYTTDGSTPQVISGDPQPETNLVHIELIDDTPVLSWLEDSTLSVGLGVDGSISEVELVDDLTCDCCNPVPAIASGSLIVSYRDFDMIDGDVVRDVVAVGSRDGGSSFDQPVAVADDHWFISGCPFSGPSAVAVGGDLVVAWMDGRQSVHPEQESTSIWVDRSTDGGSSFGPDLEVIGEGVNRWPVMALDDEGTIHLVWETAGPDGGLSYAVSTDGGGSFRLGQPLVVRSSDDDGAPTSPSVVAHGDLLVVTWADLVGGHVAAWRIR